MAAEQTLGSFHGRPKVAASRTRPEVSMHAALHANPDLHVSSERHTSVYKLTPSFAERFFHCNSRLLYFSYINKALPLRVRDAGHWHTLSTLT